MTSPDLQSRRLPLTRAPAPWLARRFAPAGPPSLLEVSAGAARVVAVPGRYCMTHVIEGRRGLALVDVGSVADLDRIAPVVDWLGKPVELVIPSHLHFDHVMGVEAAARRFGARIALGTVAHAFVAGTLPMRAPANLTGRLWMRVWLWQGLPVFHRRDMPRGLRFVLPWLPRRFDPQAELVLEDGCGIEDFPGWCVLDTPGHADDAICLHNPEAGLLVAGDTIINYEGGEWNRLVTDPAAFENTRARLEGIEVQAVFCGHGPVLMGRDALRRLRPR